MRNEKKYTWEAILPIEDEELRKADLTPGGELSMDNTEPVTGGTFLPNKYENDEYAEAGIPILKHTVLKHVFLLKTICKITTSLDPGLSGSKNRN